MIIQGIGNFTGTLTRTFSILPVPAEPEKDPSADEPEKPEAAPAAVEPAAVPAAVCLTAAAVGQPANTAAVHLPAIPKTGDAHQTEFWVLLLLAGAGLMTVCVRIKKSGKV